MAADRDASLDGLRRLLGSSSDDVAALLSGARREAEQEVHALLVRAWTDVLLDGVRSQLASAPPYTAPAPASARANIKAATAA